MNGVLSIADENRSYVLAGVRRVFDAIHCCNNRCTCRSGASPRYSGLVVALMLFLLSQPLWAKLTAGLTQSTIYDGDTVTLIIESNDRNQAGEPRLAVLQKDFEILGTRNSQHTQIINGQRTDKRQWYIELAPKNSGIVTIPAISVGNDSTEPLQLSVKPAPAAVAPGTGQAAFVKAETEPADGNVYVQQQIHYSLKLFYQDSLAEGAFDSFEIDNALVERLGEDQHYSSTVNGKRYKVIERHYAIFPEQSGELVIPAAIFNGRTAGEPMRLGRGSGMSAMMDRFFGDNMLRANGKRIRLRSDAITLNIMPRPAEYSGAHWLPGDQLELGDSWAEGPPEFRVGEPVKRTITLEVKGLESSHLPEINLPDTDGMRQYPEKPEHATRTDGEWVYGSSKQTVAYIPVTSGHITLPEISLDWWDTSTQQQRTAVIPAWEINVLAGEAGAVEAQPPADVKTGQEDNKDVPEVSADNLQSGSEFTVKQMLAAVSLFLLVLAGFAWRYWAVKARSGKATVKATPVKQQLAETSEALKKACQQNDAQAAARALLQWAEAKWPHEAPQNLGVLARRLLSGQEEIRGLERFLYAADVDSWQGDALWQAFNKGFKVVSDDKPARQAGLSPLYPY